MDLIQAYRDTRYTTKIGIVLVVDTKSEKLDQILSESDVSSAIYITAWNPFSQMMNSDENQELNGLLKSDLLTLIDEEKVINGFGEDPSGKWPGEESFLALGITKEEGTRLSEKYRQNAFVYHELGMKTELILTLPKGISDRK
ncbi:MAG: DUF3293 domain-containing protein [Saprospiraceae bacterium]|nr:DUF3293 domain-containing protein [Saprospiraceae bacterium]